MRIMLMLTAVLLLVTVYYKNEAERQQQKSAFLGHNQDILLQQIRRIYEQNKKLAEQNAALEQLAAEDTKDFDWNRDISNTLVIRKLQHR